VLPGLRYLIDVGPGRLILFAWVFLAIACPCDRWFAPRAAQG